MFGRSRVAKLALSSLLLSPAHGLRLYPALSNTRLRGGSSSFAMSATATVEAAPAAPVEKFRLDYAAPPYAIDTVHLDFHIAEEDPCARCCDPERGVYGLLVVEEPKDVEAVERSGVWKGHYHVLMGALNPAEGTSERHLSLAGLVRRLKSQPPSELVLGTDPDAEGEATALLVLEALPSLRRPGENVPSRPPSRPGRPRSRRGCPPPEIWP